MKKLTALEIIKRYECVEAADGKRIIIHKAPLLKKEDMVEEVKARKEEILQTLREEKAKKQKAYEERRKKIDAIEGLREIRELQKAWGDYHDAFAAMMEDEYNDGIFRGKKPKTEVSELLEKYPRAAAYLRAESYSYATHYVKAGAGKRALERILNGEDHEKVIADMDAEWTAYCNEHIWD